MMQDAFHHVILFPFDAEIVRALNSWVGASPRFDAVLHLLNGSALVKGVPFMTALWWLGAKDPKSTPPDFDFLGRALIGLLVALLAARWLQDYGPFHARPISDPALGLRAYRADDPNYFVKLNSFPSDHAVEFCAMSYAIATRKLWLGLAGFFWTFLFILLPRVYFGYHFPSDIFAGALLGVAVMDLWLRVPAPRAVCAAVQRFGDTFYGLRQAALFAMSVELAVNFDHIRDLLTALKVV